jgi:methionyl-tRNA formyltransferase
MTNYLVATIKPWNIAAFETGASKLPGKWHLVTDPDDLTPEFLRQLSPRYIFFPHWSWKVPDSITSNYECVCFHMTDLPYGRGGSPLQNLILRGHKETRVSALRMVTELDAGPIYKKQALSLDGSAGEIYHRLASTCVELMAYITAEVPDPVEQQGQPVYFERRKPADSRITPELDQQKVYDLIRMLDAPTYPKAFIELGDLRLEFEQAAWQGQQLTATVRFNPRNKDDDQ